MLHYHAHLNSNIISSSSLRIATQTVGVIDVSLYIKKTCTKEKLLRLLKKQERTQEFKTIKNNFEKLVSSDFKKLRYNTAIDHRFTDVKMGKMLKMMIWYDNEWGYASKVIETLKYSDSI